MWQYDEKSGDARKKMRELQRMAQRVCVMILRGDYEKVDVLIARQNVRQRCQELFPGAMDLYDMIYESRFDRLSQQFEDDFE